VANPNYLVGVWVRSAGATADAAEATLSIPFGITGTLATLTSLTADKTAPQPVGTTITFTATASGGVTPYQTKWWLWNGTTWSLLRDWATGTSFAWTPTVANPNYLVGVWVRSAGATADAAEATLSIPFGITIGP
jgi:cell wall-associated protease